MSTSFTQADVNALERKIAAATKKIKFSENKEVELADLDQMKETLEYMKSQINQAASPSKSTRVAVARYSRC